MSDPDPPAAPADPPDDAPGAGPAAPEDADAPPGHSGGPGPVPGRRGVRGRYGRAFVAVGVSAVVVAVLARYALFSEGVLHGSGVARAASLVVGSVLLISAAAVVHGWRLTKHRSPPAGPAPAAAGQQERPHPLATAAVVLSVAVGATAAADAFAQDALSEAQAAPCAGASVAGSRFLAVTSETRIGVNVRSGPGTDFPQTGRFTSGCTLGFDGYCVGEPAPDFLTGEPDVRWLRLHRSPGYVSASVMRSVTADSGLRPAPHPKCPGDGAMRAYDPAEWDPPRGGPDGAVVLAASSPGAVLLGFAVLLPEPLRRGTGQVRQVALVAADENGHGAAQWNTSASTRDMQAPGDVVAAVSVCLAGAVPQPGTQKLVRFSWDGNALRGPLAIGTPPDPRALRRLETAACRSAYTFGPPSPAPAP